MDVRLAQSDMPGAPTARPSPIGDGTSRPGRSGEDRPRDRNRNRPGPVGHTGATAHDNSNDTTRLENP
ncbi:hypothetical protein SSP531S_54190 [Streptomyces spongiicola]|uniref:Uncharacterized protein n=1 Tax=Streptomyces spongiicola TaxID=1690221 RepID=A0A388T7A7_9ACTN|nr:hypothetical protein SSP531S_54190 [Streptomyces spongiicola]